MNNSTRLLVLVAVCFCFQNSFAQEIKKRSFPYPTYRLGLSPSALVNFFPGIQVSNDFGINDRIQVAMETAYIFNSTYGSNANGFRLKLGPEFNLASNHVVRYSIGVHYVHRTTIADRVDEINFWQDQYIEYVDFKRKKQLNGVELYNDLSWRLSSRLTLETGFGIGQGTLVVSDSEKFQYREPDDFDIFFEDFSWFGGFDEEGEYTFPIISFNLNLSYTIIP